MIRRLALAVVALAVLGCSGKPRPPRPGDAEAERTQIILTKLQAYLQCLDHAERVFGIADLYVARAGAAPTVHVPEDPEQCVEGIAEAKALPPAMPELESAADGYAKALGSVFALTTRAHASLDTESKDHAPAKVAALRPQLLAAFREFDEAHGAFFDRVRAVNHTIRLEQLARRKQRDGRTFPVLLDETMLRAEDLVQAATTPWDRLDTIDGTVLTSNIEAFEGALEELSSYALANTTEVEGMLKGYRGLVARARSYLVAARQLAKRAKDRIAFTSADEIMIAAHNERAVIGTPAALIDAYNHLIEGYSPL